jgi:hypothetical protein
LALRPHAPEFASRGGVKPAAAELQVYRITAAGQPEPVRGRMLTGDELGFVYRNLAGRKYLLVFARDEHGHVYWYYPAWNNPADAPVAISIEGGEGSHELPEVTVHDFDGNHLELHAVFTDKQLSVREVEARIAENPRSAVSEDAIEADVPLEIVR